MTPKSQTIAPEEWELYRQTITRLYSEKPLKDVMIEMESKHGFKASRYQFEAQFRDWRIRKNTTRKEWEMHFEESDITDPATGPRSVRMTPAGCNKSLASFKRARRYVKKRPVPEQSVLVQRERIQASPQPQDAIDDYFNKISAPPAVGSPFELQHALESLGTMPASHAGGKLNSQVATGSLSTLDPYDYTTFGDSIPELDLGQIFNRDFNAQLSVAGPLTIPLHIPPNPAFLEHHSPLEVSPFSLWSNSPAVESSMFSNTLCSSRFADLEEHLRSKGFAFARRNTTELTRHGSSPSGGFGLGFFADLVLSKQQSISRKAFDLESAIRRLGNFIPGERTTVITQDREFEAKFIRILLFSLVNGFAGLNDTPIENILKFLGRLQIVSPSLLMILKDGPAHTSRTLIDNIFRAAIEAKDERILKQLLEHQLVNVNDTVCFFDKNRYTPVERAASLEAYNVMTILVSYGADVNKTYIENKSGNGGALTQLILAVSGLNRYNFGPSSAVTATPEIIETVDMLISAGAIATEKNLYHAGRAFTSYNIACRLSLCILPSDHRLFFQNESIVQVAQYTNEDAALQIIYNMIKLCERDACGKCLKVESTEWGAVQAAKRGYLRLVQLLIDYVPSPTRIFTAAIRSKRRRLIDYVLTRNPELDPEVQTLEGGGCTHEDYTTPLAEAVSAGNEALVNYLHEAGALNKLNEGDRFRPLVIAAACRGNMSYMQMLLSRANSSFDPYRPTGLAVYEALQNGHEDIALLLLANGAKVRPVRHGGFICSPLKAALQRKNASLVRAILSSDIEDVGSEEFATAAELEDASTISILTLADPIISTSSESLRTLCMHCMKTDNVKFFQDLMDSIPPDDKLNDCLREALKMGHSEMVRYLLDIGANPFEDGVLESAFPDHPDMLQLIFSKFREERTVPKRIGARIIKSIIFESLGGSRALDALLETQAVNFIIPENTEDKDSDDGEDDDFWTPLGLALDGLSRHRDSNSWIVERLLRAGSDPNKIARIKGSDATESHTGLMLAIETAIQDVIQLLIDYGADINKKPCFTVKRTPLQYAAELGDLDIVRMLLNLGADVNEEPALRNGGTALQFAAVSGNCNIAAELLNHGALLGALPSKVNGRWPLEAAAEHGRLDMIQFLWKIRVALLGKVAGFERRQCLRAMNFARANGHIGCRDLISELSGIPVGRLDVENYGSPWLAYDGPDVLLAKLFSQVGTELVPSLAPEDGMVQQEIPYCIPSSLGL
ncbi:hypothetical protein OIDMADRAFT_33566 [Oidiodendron maius Zn]|uniref:Clr5 domain-containing protein n=1 Tax=Oidiodendron maius (strain Zn) TaxID=913774 RepID=A0A0C3GYC6_OIDMZ|nr:hypothetical protein OIDMADRAFT_33566 [Oidiodendron maius Zn]